MSDAPAACPRCGVPMGTYAHEGVTLDLCPRCRGLWFDRQELLKVTRTPVALEEGRSLPSGSSRSADRACPRCARPLCARAVPDLPGLSLDECPRCWGLFVDAGELQSLHRLRVRRLRRQSREEAKLRREMDAAVVERRTVPRPDSAGLEVERAELSGKDLVAYLLGLPYEVGGPAVARPYSVYAVLFALVGVFLWQLRQEDAGFRLACVPDEVMAGRSLHTLLTACFLHGGVGHLLGNGYFLWLFGDDVEERVGHFRFLGFYLLWGLAGSLLSAMLTLGPGRTVPHLGASGAIAGVAGAYVMLFPLQRIAQVHLLAMVRTRIPAWWYLGLWIAMQLAFLKAGVPGVGWWAHIGGFGAGAMVGLLYRYVLPPRRQPAGTA